MATQWIHSKAGMKLLMTILIISMLSTGYLIYMAQWLTLGFQSAYQLGNAGTFPKGWRNNDPPDASVPRTTARQLNLMIEKQTIRFISITLLFLLSLIIITILFLIKPLNELNDSSLTLKDEDLDDLDDDELDDDVSDNELDDDDLDDTLLAEELLVSVKNMTYTDTDFSDKELSRFGIGNDPDILANSYNKMMDALQRINELEKEHSIKLAEANEHLQREITERKRAEKEIRYLSNRLISSHEEARKNLAQDLHDEFGQTLAALHLNAEALRNAMPEELKDQKKGINDLVRLIEQLGDKIRRISSDLRPDLLDDLGLVPTLEWYLKEFREQKADIQVDFQAVGFRKRLSSELELVLYRIFQEGLNNVVKHSKADYVSVTLTYSYPNVIFILKDDGVGFEQNKSTDGIGLLGMRERVVSVNGMIHIVSGKRKGTTIRVELPVED